MRAMGRRQALRAGMIATAIAGGAGAVTSPEAATAASTVAEGWVSVTDHGAVGDGVTDDTAAIQAAFDAAKAATPHRSVLLPAGRTYKVTKQLTVSAMTDFVICGYGATLALGPEAERSVFDPEKKSDVKNVLLLTGCRQFTVLGLEIVDTSRTWQYVGLLVSSSSNGVIDGVTVRDVRFSGIGVFDKGQGPSDNILITNCTTRGTRFGISVAGKDIRITNNHVAMDWPSTAEAKAHGGVWPGRTVSDFFDGILINSGSDRVVVSGNTVAECGQTGIYLQTCTNVTITGNTVVGCQLRGIEVDGFCGAASGTATAFGISISGNTVTDCRCEINLIGCQDVTVVGNRLRNSRTAGQSIVGDSSCLGVNLGTSNVIAVGNHIHQSNSTYPAIWANDQSTAVTLAWNAITADIEHQTPKNTVIIRRDKNGNITTENKLIATGGIGVGTYKKATTPGKVVNKIEVFTATGESMGWVPVYDAIS